MGMQGAATGSPHAMRVDPASAMAKEASGAHAETSSCEGMASIGAESKRDTGARHFLGEHSTLRPTESSKCPSALRDAPCSNPSHYKGGAAHKDAEAPPAAAGHEAGVGADDAAGDGLATQPAPVAGTKRDREARENSEPYESLWMLARVKAPKLEPRDEVDGGEDDKSSCPDTVSALGEECSYSTADLEAIIERQSRELASLRANRLTLAPQDGTASDDSGDGDLPHMPDAVQEQSLAEGPRPEAGPGGASPDDAPGASQPTDAEPWSPAWPPQDGEGHVEQREGEVGAAMAAADETPGASASEQAPSDEAASIFSCGLEALSVAAAQASEKGEKVPKPLKLPKPGPPKPPKLKVEPVTAPRCHHCGTTETPKWRCSMTLCNACGLRASEGRKSKAIRPAHLVADPGMMGMPLQMPMPQMPGGVYPYYPMIPGAMMHPCMGAMGAMPLCGMPTVPMPGQDGSYSAAIAAHQMGLVPRPGYAFFDPNQAHATSSMMAPFGVAEGGSMQQFGMIDHSRANAAAPLAPAAAAGSYPYFPFTPHAAPYYAPSAAGAVSCGAAMAASIQQLS